MFVVGAASPHARGTPTGILIGSQPRIRKGFVIALTIFAGSDRICLQLWPGTVSTPTAEASQLTGGGVF